MKLFGLKYIYTRKCHHETPCVAISTNKKWLFFFTKAENRKAKQVLPGWWCQLEWDDIRKGCKRVNMVKILCLMYINEKVRAVETIPGMVGGET
jgi:hypothetical protein